MCAHNAVAAFVHENTSEIVSSVHGAAASSAATRPPHRSTTVSPPTLTHTDAPTSSRFVKFSMNASPTLENSGSHRPVTRPRPTSTSINISLSAHSCQSPTCLARRYGRTAVAWISIIAAGKNSALTCTAVVAGGVHLA